MQFATRGRRRDPEYKFGPRIPLIWKIIGVGVLGVIAVGLAAYAILN